MRKDKLMLAIVLVSQLIVPLSKTALAEGDLPLSIGEYITFGKYYDEPILWRCIDIDGNGILMLSDKILCFKAFDVPGRTGGSHDRIRRFKYGRDADGSNYWGDSNIRSWLNSAAAAGEVEWLCGNPPSDDIMENGGKLSNPYSEEKGFLADGNFTASERCAIKEVCHKNLLDPLDAESADGGSVEAWSEWSYYDSMPGKYNEICFEYVRDKMFLLDYYQLWELEQKGEILGVDYHKAVATEAASMNDKRPEYKKQGDQFYLLRTPYGYAILYGSDWSEAWGTGIFSSVSYDYAYLETDSGIRPAFYLNEDTMIIKSGSGSESDPYVIDGNPYGANVGDVSGNIYSTDILTYVDDVPITSYNIGGKTIIPIEELRDYGFEVNWNEEDRVLEAEVSENPVYTSGQSVSRGVSGTIAGNTYYTDITVFINGMPFAKSYNIGGITCVAVEDLGMNSETDELLSEYGMRYTYDDVSRTLKLYVSR